MRSWAQNWNLRSSGLEQTSTAKSKSSKNKDFLGNVGMLQYHSQNDCVFEVFVCLFSYFSMMSFSGDAAFAF